MSCLRAHGVQTALQKLPLQSFSLGSTVSVAVVEMLRAELSQRCTKLKALSLSLSLSREENVSSVVLFSSDENSTGAGGPRDIGCANLRSIRLQRCSHEIIPQLSHAVDFCRSRPALRDIAIVRLGAGDSDSQQWSCLEPDGDGTEFGFGDPFTQLFDSCMGLESLELSATDAWPAYSLAKLMQVGELGILDSKHKAHFRRLTVHGADAFMDSSRETFVNRTSQRSVGCASATISPTMHYESVRARTNATAARGPTRNFFFGPS